MLGFDETIDGFCREEHRFFDNKWYLDGKHAGSCANANNNILSLFSDRLPYNMCRNVCV